MGINKIMKRGRWKSNSTFKKFYGIDKVNENNFDKLNHETGAVIRLNFDKNFIIIYGNLEISIYL